MAEEKWNRDVYKYCERSPYWEWRAFSGRPGNRGQSLTPSRRLELSDFMRASVQTILVELGKVEMDV